MPDSNVLGTYNNLITEITSNYYDFISNNNPFVVFYYIDSVNNKYNYLIYILTSTNYDSAVEIDDSNYTYECRLISCEYNTTTSTFGNIVDEGSFSTKAITTSTVDTYAVLNCSHLTILSNNVNITPTILKYTTMLQKNLSVLDTFVGYVIGSNDTGTNKLFLSNPVIRADDYWLDATPTTLSADNIVHICSYNIDNSGNIIDLVDSTDTSISETLSDLKLIRTDKYMFKNNVELVSPTYEVPTA